MLVKHNADRLHHVGESLTFLPGINNVDAVEWEKALQLPAFKALVDDGTFEVLEAKGQPVMSEDISKMTQKSAIDVVKATVTAELLHTWAKGEKRPDVAKAIAAQLKAIDPTEKE
jgi:hypothetical protein